MSIPQNTIILRPPLAAPASNPRIPNTIPKEQLQVVQTTFLTEKSNMITQLTHKLQQENSLILEEWTQITKEMDDLVPHLSNTFIKICAKPPPPPLMWLPTKTSPKTMEKQLKIHHNIRKIIFITQHNNNWRNLPCNNPQPPIDPTTTKEWIKEIALIGKKAKKEASKI
jgi:hypothetical protein